MPVLVDTAYLLPHSWNTKNAVSCDDNDDNNVGNEERDGDGDDSSY